MAVKYYIFASIILLASVGCRERSIVFEIPEGYIGWVKVNYNSSDCKNQQNTIYASVVRIEPDGTGCSDSWKGAKQVSLMRFYYVDASGDRIKQLESKGWGEGGWIWGAYGSWPEDKTMRFFVGSEDDFKNTAHQS